MAPALTFHSLGPFDYLKDECKDSSVKYLYIYTHIWIEFYVTWQTIFLTGIPLKVHIISYNNFLPMYDAE